MTTFRKLSEGWNAGPNAPYPRVQEDGGDLLLTFSLDIGGLGRLRFRSCSRYRLGDTNDEGWYRGQCRFSKLAPKWGEFYEIEGDLRLDACSMDWVELPQNSSEAQRHFLFYFKDETFECDAADWNFEVLRQPHSS